MSATWQPRPEAEGLHIISLKHSYGKENRREHCRRFARWDFCRSCLQLMSSRNTAVYRYHGILRRYIVVGHFSIPRIPKRNRHGWLTGQYSPYTTTCNSVVYSIALYCTAMAQWRWCLQPSITDASRRWTWVTVTNRFNAGTTTTGPEPVSRSRTPAAGATRTISTPRCTATTPASVSRSHLIRIVFIWRELITSDIMSTIITDCKCGCNMK